MLLYLFFDYSLSICQKNGNWKMVQGCRLSPIDFLESIWIFSFFFTLLKIFLQILKNEPNVTFGYVFVTRFYGHKKFQKGTIFINVKKNWKVSYGVWKINKFIWNEKRIGERIIYWTIIFYQFVINFLEL